MDANIARLNDDFAFVMRNGASNTAATRWIVDSGASQHMIPHKHFFNTYKPASGRKVFMSDNDMVEAVGKGFILVETCMKDCAQSIRMFDVFHVPNLHSNLLPVSKLISRGLRRDVGHCFNGVQLVPIGHECYEWGRNKFYDTFR